MEKVHEIYKCIGTVMEINPLCIPGFDRPCLHFEIELQHVLYHVGVHPPNGHGIILQ